ncbi:MAG: amidohydrolase family protein [Gemmatimonadetes bacterium]|nr:amidohydrolase family protein [Gemmatimonadota bacterium]
MTARLVHRAFRLVLGVLATTLAATAPLAAQNFDELVAVPRGTVALTNAKVFDGTGAPAATGQTIIIEGDQIAAVGPTGSVDVPSGARVIDLSGQTVIPGLVGLHNHSYYTGGNGRAAQLSFSGSRLYLASGVTTIRTTGAQQPYAELNLKSEIDAGRVVGPTMFTTGPYLTGEQSSSQTMTQLEGPEQARRVVRYWSEEGVDWFKAYTWISRAELGAAIEEAHRHGVKVTAHLCSVGYREAVALGIDNLEHGLFANSEYAPNKSPDECPPGFRNGYADLDIQGPEVQATFRDMIENDVPMTSTLVVYEISVAGREPIDERVFDVLAPEIAEEVRAISIQRRAGRGAIDPAVYQKALEYEKAFVEAGGLLAAGVDPTGYGAAPPGFGDQRNYELLLEAGFSAAEVLQIMSHNGAKVLGIDDRVGTIAAGMTADLVVIDADLEEAGDLHDTSIVFRHGIGWDSAKLIDSVRGIVGVR